MKKITCAVLFVLAICQSGWALQLQFYPADRLFLNDAEARRNTYDVIAHLLVISNDSDEEITLRNVDVTVANGASVIQEIHLAIADLVSATNEINGMNAQGMKIMADVIVPEAALGKNVKLGSSAQLKPGEALIAQNIYLTIQRIPTTMRATALASTPSKNDIKGSTEIPIVQYRSPNKYIYPLQGVWYMQSIPNVTSHHRWMSQTEFGIDFLKLNENGSLYKTDGKTPEDFYAYGQPVLAAADGIVVLAINDAVQNWDAWLPRSGESEEEFSKRSEKYHLDAMKKDMYRAVTGNLVAIEHPGGEYSAYAHLKTGSVRVKPGDRVKQGQQIAEVGDTGDYYMAHLHFQISNSTDLLTARSVPFEFVNLGRRPELGHFARIK
ncbi:MAG TPA: M23 family metallopeptidase [Acidobacteriota bacterium]|nr:M23 family metallopeptidase [Acidobacteriota bacterium]